MLNRKMLFYTVFFVFITSTLTTVSGDEHHTGDEHCMAFFLKEMFRHFEHGNMDDKIQTIYQKLKQELSTDEENKIAFTAGLYGEEETYSDNAIIKFTRNITNIGGGLNLTDGVFHCPKPGIYSFFVAIQSSTDNAYAEIHKNDKLVMYVFTDEGPNTWRSGSNQVILELEKGDRVFVRSQKTSKYSSHASQFSGHKL